jgi:hypothetical protein
LAGGLLAGCSSATAQPSATLGGAPQATVGPSASATPAPSSSATLSADFAVDFDLTITGTPTQVTILTKAKALIVAYEQAVEHNDPGDSTYQALITGQATTSLYSSIESYKSAGQRPIGVLLFDQFTTDVSAGVGADVLFCEDRSQVKLVDFTTGAPLADNGAAKQHWDIGFKANSNGTWSIAYVSAQAVAAGSTECT